MVKMHIALTKIVKIMECEIKEILVNEGNMVKIKKRNLSYCRICGTRCAATKATARLLGIEKDTVNRVILRAGEHFSWRDQILTGGFCNDKFYVLLLLLS